MKGFIQAVVLILLFAWGVRDYQRFRVMRGPRRAKKLQGSSKAVRRLRSAVMNSLPMDRYRD